MLQKRKEQRNIPEVEMTGLRMNQCDGIKEQRIDARTASSKHDQE